MAGQEGRLHAADGDLRPDALGPTTSNITPARIVFVVIAGGQARLKPHLDAGNVRQTMEGRSPPFSAMISTPRTLPRLLSRTIQCASGSPTPRQQDHRLAQCQPARRLFHSGGAGAGLDCGPMGGFNHAGIDAEFFAGTQIKSNFLCNLGYGAPGGFRPRNERLGFDEACKIL